MQNYSYKIRKTLMLKNVYFNKTTCITIIGASAFTLNSVVTIHKSGDYVLFCIAILLFTSFTPPHQVFVAKKL